ncbi:MAG: phosphoribosyltransferase [Epsilonproteobacteria bacterium]|nr:phosphoribosyltransferase [Campylobacterota bacterium]
MEKLYYSYEEFRLDVISLLPQLQKDYDTIIAIARGGLTFAQALAEALEIRNLQTISTLLYDGTTKKEDFSLYDTTNLQHSKKVLVVDDISDSGETLSKVMQHLEKKHPSITFETITLFYKRTSLFQPTYYIHESTQWINFFWEVDFTLEPS